MVGGICNMEKAIELRLTKLFRTAYYLADKERPFTDFAGLIQLQNSNGADLGTTYTNDKAAQSFISSIAGVYFDELKYILSECDFFLVLVDGSTDKSDIEKELIFVRIIKDGYPTMAYLKNCWPSTCQCWWHCSSVRSSIWTVWIWPYKLEKNVGRSGGWWRSCQCRLPPFCINHIKGNSPLPGNNPL